MSTYSLHPSSVVGEPRTIMSALMQSNGSVASATSGSSNSANAASASGTSVQTQPNIMQQAQSHPSQVNPLHLPQPRAAYSAFASSPTSAPPHLLYGQMTPPHRPVQTSGASLSSAASSVSSSSFSTPNASTASSPYLTPMTQPAHAVVQPHSSLSLSEPQILPGSRVQLRGPDHLHPKIASYAHTIADILQLPAHPNTWYGVRLHDGKQVKLRKTAFDVLSYGPNFHPFHLSHPAQAINPHAHPYAAYASAYHVPNMSGLNVSTPQSGHSIPADLEYEDMQTEDNEGSHDSAHKSTGDSDLHKPHLVSTKAPPTQPHLISPSQSQPHSLRPKRKPAPRNLSPPTSEDENVDDGEGDEDQDGMDDGDEADNGGMYDGEDGGELDEDDYDEEDDDDAGGRGRDGKSPRGKKNSSGSSNAKPARQRRGRGRALLGLNVVITNGRYKNETGLVVRGANGYYSVKFHKLIPELRPHDNTAMKRSSELAPITPSGKRLQLPIPPAQRKIIKAQAAAAMQIFTSNQRSPALGARDPHANGSGSGQKRKAVSSTSSPRGRRTALRRKDAQGGYASGSGDENESDQEHVDDDVDDNDSRRRRRRATSYDSEDMMDQGSNEDTADYYDEEGAPHLTHSRTHSSNSSRSSSPHSHSQGNDSDGSQSPTRTELLSPNLDAHSPHVHATQTPLQTSSSIPPSPLHGSGESHRLPAIHLPPSIDTAHLQSKSFRASSPRVKHAASILLELLNEGISEIPPNASYTLTPIKAVRPEQWIGGATQRQSIAQR